MEANKQSVPRRARPGALRVDRQDTPLARAISRANASRRQAAAKATASRKLIPVPPPRPSDATQPHPHARFARMVAQHVQGGLLRFTARHRLMLLAKGLGIGEFKANLIIAEVLHDFQSTPADQFLAPAHVAPTKTAAPALASLSTGHPRYLLRLLAASAAAIAVNLLAWLLLR